MKIRIASSVALAAAIALGATGCSLTAPQGTLEQYAPSDGIDVNVENLDIRNFLLIADESGEKFNIVFSAVNTTHEQQQLQLTFMGEGSKTTTAEFAVPAGTTAFGDPAGEIAPVLVSIPGTAPGDTVNTYFQTAGSDEVSHNAPVLDGTLLEYRDLVLPADFSQAKDESAAEKKLAAEDAEASQSKVND